MKIKNLSLVYKVAVPAILGLVSLLAVSLLAYKVISYTADTARQITNVNVKSVVSLADISDSFSAINANIYQILTKKAADSTYDAKKDLGATKDDLAALTVSIEAYLKDHPNDDLVYVLKEIKGSKEEKIPGYVDALNVIDTMLELDFSGAVNAVAPFSAKYDRVKQRLQTVRENSYQDAQKTTAAMFVTIDQNMLRGKLALVLVVLIQVGVCYILGRELIGSIKKIASATHTLAQGETTTDIEALTRRDELGVVVESLKGFKENIIRVTELQSEQERSRAEAAENRRRTMEQMADSFESTVKSVVTGVSVSADSMRSNAERLSTLAGETKHRSSIVSSVAGQAAHTATQVATAAQELTASIGEISAQVQKASVVSSQASEQASHINKSMHLLVEKSGRVGEVIQFITNIASQINLLALNATIESARAGEAGRGFAVVASEVKNLASQTGKATEEIVQQVQSMQEATHQAVEAVDQIIGIISEISSSTAGVAAAVEEQSVATNQISHSIAQTASGTNEISQNIQAVEHGADETGESSLEVLNSAKDLSTQAATLNSKVDEFISMVRRA